MPATLTTTPSTVRRRRGVSRSNEGVEPCNPCRGTGEVPADALTRQIAVNRGRPIPVDMACPACRGTGSRRPSEQRAAEAVCPDFVPASWYETPDRTEPEPAPARWPHWGPRTANPTAIAAMVADIRARQERRRSDTATPTATAEEQQA